MVTKTEKENILSEEIENAPATETEDDNIPTVESETDVVLTEEIETEGILAYLKTPKTKKRIWEIDFLRGFCIFLMLFDHAALMLSSYFGPSWYGGYAAMRSSSLFGAKLCTLCEQYYFYSDLRAIGHPIVLFIFFSISGISCAFSRSNLKRGIQLAIVSALYTLVTYILDETMSLGCYTTFGVLHFYAFCIIFWAVVSKLCNDNVIAKTMISGFMVILVAVLYYCYKAPADTPEWLFFVFSPKNADGTPSFYSQSAVSPGDLFPLIPWSAFFFAGTFLQPFLYSKKRSLLPVLDGKWNKPMCFIGRHALLFYILHVVVIAVVLMLVSQIFFGTWGLI